MEVTEALMDRMDQYLEGKMSAGEAQAFESELRDNPKLADLLAQHQETILTIESVGVKNELSKIIEQNRKREQTETKTISINRNVIAIAASIAILLGAFFYFRPFSPSQGQALYQAFYQADPGLPTMMGATDNPIFADAMVSYKEGEYQKALESFKMLSVANSSNDTLSFYQGICQLELGQTTESIESFSKINLSKPIWGNKAEWYQTMALLNANQLPEARSKLEKIANDGTHRYQQQAKEVLEALE